MRAARSCCRTIGCRPRHVAVRIGRGAVRQCATSARRTAPGTRARGSPRSRCPRARRCSSGDRRCGSSPRRSRSHLPPSQQRRFWASSSARASRSARCSRWSRAGRRLRRDRGHRRRDRHRQGARRATIAARCLEAPALTVRRRSTAARCRKACSRASCSVTCAARSPGAAQPRTGNDRARRWRHAVPRRARPDLSRPCRRACCA